MASSRFGVLHGAALILIVYTFLNAFIIGIQVSPDVHLISLPWSYVTQFTAMILSFLTFLGFVEFAYWSAGEKGVGKFNLASVVGLVMGIAGVILVALTLLSHYQLSDPLMDRWVGGFLFFGSFVVLITYRELLVNFGKATKLLAK